MSNVAEMESAWTTVASQTPQAPWEAIEQAADSLVAEPARLETLRKALDEFITEPYRHRSFAPLYVPAILELARPRLDDATRAEAGRYLVSAIIAAGKHDDDALLEILEYVARRYGRASLDAALEALQSLDHENAAYFYLWTTLYAVKEGDDADARWRVVDLCRRTLQQAVDKTIDADLAVMAAYILAELRDADCRPAIETLIEATAGITDGPQRYAADEYRTALKLLDGQAAADASLDVTADNDEFRKRIEEDWPTLHAFYEERDRRQALVAGFKAMADLAKQFVSESRSENPADLAIADEFLRRAFIRTGGHLDQLDDQALSNVLLQDLPAFLSGDRTLFEQIPSTVIGLLEHLKEHDQLADVRSLTKWVRKHRNDIVAAAMDTARWSHEKLVASLSLHEGGRVATGDEIGTMLDGISGRRTRKRQLYQRTGRRTRRRVQPIVNKTQKVGRNDPCPCGSGKKYKKCCGSPTKS